MKNKIESAVKRFTKSVKSVDFENAKLFAESIGYRVVFFHTTKGDEIIRKTGCEEEAKHYKAFTWCKINNLIVIDYNQPCETRFYLLMHEIGHILLGHIGNNVQHMENPILMDAEASSFITAVLNYRQNRTAKAFRTMIALCLGIVIGFSAGKFAPPIQPTAIQPTKQPVATIQPDMQSQQEITDIVYVTQSGSKFHRAGCRYTKDKDCTAMSRAEAIKKYSPCAVCEP